MLVVLGNILLFHGCCVLLSQLHLLLLSINLPLFFCFFAVAPLSTPCLLSLLSRSKDADMNKPRLLIFFSHHVSCRSLMLAFFILCLLAWIFSISWLFSAILWFHAGCRMSRDSLQVLSRTRGNISFATPHTGTYGCTETYCVYSAYTWDVFDNMI